MANPQYGQNKFDNDVDTHDEYLDFVSGYQGNLIATGVTVNAAAALAAVKGGDETLAEVDAATYVANAVNIVSSDASAVHTIGYLPPAKKGIHLAVSITGTLDEANASTISCNNSVGTVKPSGNVFAKQLLGIQGTTASSVFSAGTVATPTSENLLWTAAATNPKYGPGTQIHFYCPKDGQWLVKFFPLKMGTGVVGVLTVS